MITIVDTGGANIMSIQMGLQRLQQESILTTDAEQIRRAAKVILPGVGAAGVCMQKLNNLNLPATLQKLTQPVLGICLGMQILFTSSEEGQVNTLNIIPGKVKKISTDLNLPVPHMGWNNLKITQDSLLLKNISENDYFYFVHSYFAEKTACSTSHVHYGESLTATVEYKNFFGVQFHPEKSSHSGEKILKNFLEISC